MSIFQLKEMVNEIAGKDNIKRNLKGTLKGDSAQTFYDVMRKLSASINKEEPKTLSKKDIQKLSDVMKNIQGSVGSKDAAKAHSDSSVDKGTVESEKLVKNQFDTNEKEKVTIINKNEFSNSDESIRENAINRNANIKEKESQIIEKNKAQNENLSTQKLGISKDNMGQTDLPTENRSRDEKALVSTNKVIKGAYEKTKQHLGLHRAAKEGKSGVGHTAQITSHQKSVIQDGSDDIKELSRKAFEGYKGKTNSTQMNAQDVQKFGVEKNYEITLQDKDYKISGSNKADEGHVNPDTYKKNLSKNADSIEQRNILNGNNINNLTKGNAEVNKYQGLQQATEKGKNGVGHTVHTTFRQKSSVQDDSDNAKELSRKAFERYKGKTGGTRVNTQYAQTIGVSKDNKDQTDLPIEDRSKVLGYTKESILYGTNRVARNAYVKAKQHQGLQETGGNDKSSPEQTVKPLSHQNLVLKADLNEEKNLSSKMLRNSKEKTSELQTTVQNVHKADAVKNKKATFQDKDLRVIDSNKTARNQVNLPVDDHSKSSRHNKESVLNGNNIRGTYEEVKQYRGLHGIAGKSKINVGHTAQIASRQRSTIQAGSDNVKELSKKVLEGYKGRSDSAQINARDMRKVRVLKDENNASEYGILSGYLPNKKERNNDEILDSNDIRKLKDNPLGSRVLHSKVKAYKSKEPANVSRIAVDADKNTDQKISSTNSVSNGEGSKLTDFNSVPSINAPENLQEKEKDLFSNKDKNDITIPQKKEAHLQWEIRGKASVVSDKGRFINENISIGSDGEIESLHDKDWTNGLENINAVHRGSIYWSAANDNSHILQNIVNNLISISKKIRILISDVSSGKKRSLISNNAKIAVPHGIKVLQGERRAIVDSMEITVMRKTNVNNQRNTRMIYELKNTMLETIERFKNNHGVVKYKSMYIEGSNDASKGSSKAHKDLFENILAMAKNDLSDKAQIKDGKIKVLSSNRSLNVNEVFNRIVQTIIRRSNENNFTEVATVKLHPPRLGEIEVVVTKEGNNIEIKFKVFGKDAQDAIEKSLHLLSDRLNSQGFSVERIEVTQESRNSYNENYREDENQREEHKEGNRGRGQREQKKEGENSDDK